MLCRVERQPDRTTGRRSTHRLICIGQCHNFHSRSVKVRELRCSKPVSQTFVNCRPGTLLAVVTAYLGAGSASEEVWTIACWASPSDKRSSSGRDPSVDRKPFQESASSHRAPARTALVVKVDSVKVGMMSLQTTDRQPEAFIVLLLTREEVQTRLMRTSRVDVLT